MTDRVHAKLEAAVKKMDAELKDSELEHVTGGLIGLLKPAPVKEQTLIPVLTRTGP
jgi:hypothetical protein